MPLAAFLASLVTRARSLPCLSAQGVELARRLRAEDSVGLSDVSVCLLAVVFPLAVLCARDCRSIHDVARFESVAPDTGVAWVTADPRRRPGSYAQRAAAQAAHDRNDQCKPHVFPNADGVPSGNNPPSRPRAP